MNYCLPGEEGVGKVVKRPVNEEDFNLGGIGLWAWSSELFVRCALWFVRSISLVTVVDINISGVFLISSSCQL